MKDITEISYSRDANKHFITGVYITINDQLQVRKFGNAGLKSEIYRKKKNNNNNNNLKE